MQTMLSGNQSRHTLKSSVCLLFLVAAVMLFPACKAERCNTPFGVGGELDLLQPDFINLYNNPGGTLVINRGHKGILVNCVGLGNYVAFDCACPLDHDIRMLPDSPTSAMLLECPVCGSRFEVYFGNPLDGSKTGCPLYQYNTQFDGRVLVIY